MNHADHTQIHVAYSGKLYVDEASRIRNELLQYVEEGKTHFVIDLSQVEYMDSSGLGVLVAVQKKVRGVDGKFVIKGLHGVVKELFELTRLTRVFEIEEE